MSTTPPAYRRTLAARTRTTRSALVGRATAMPASASAAEVTQLAGRVSAR
ncbi:MAG TPA: hypothetical protein VGO86_11525 [Candidatus Dormibacteraeota bacterium]